MRDIELKTTCNSGEIHKVEIYFYKNTLAVRRKVLTPDCELAKYFEDKRKFGNKYFIKQNISLTYREVLAVLKWVIFHPFKFKKYINRRVNK